MEQAIVLEALKKAKESIDHSNVILADMEKNKGEYNATDLAWRLISLSKATLDSMGLVVDSLLGMASQTMSDDDSMRHKLPDEIIEEHATLPEAAQAPVAEITTNESDLGDVMPFDDEEDVDLDFDDEEDEPADAE